MTKNDKKIELKKIDKWLKSHKRWKNDKSVGGVVSGRAITKEEYYASVLDRRERLKKK